MTKAKNYIYMFVLLVATMLTFESCATQKTKYETKDIIKYIIVAQHDTIVNNIQDSTYHTIIQKNDTVFDTKYVVKKVWRERIVIRHDTCWRDSISVQYEEKVREITKIPKFYYYTIGISIISIIFALYKLLKWLQIL